MAIKYLDAKRIQGNSGASDGQDYSSQTGNATSQLDESANKYGVEIESTNPLIGKALESFTMALRKRNSPTGEIYAKKYNSSGTLQATSSNYIDASTLPTEGNVVFENKTWNFAGDVSTTYVVNSGTGQNDSTDGSITILAQKFITGHTLIGTKVRSFTVNLKKVGTPTGTVTARIINSSNVEQAAFGTLDIATLTTSAVATTFTNSTNEYLLVDGDRIALYYAGGTALDWQMDTGTESNTNGSYYTGSWTERSRDANMSVTYISPTIPAIADGDRIVFEAGGTASGSHDGTNQITFHRVSGGFTDTVSIALYTSSWTTPPSGDPLYKINEIVDDKATLVTAPPKCATFDGSNDQVTGLGNLMSGTGAWSLSIWLYHTGGTSGNDGVMSPDGSLEMMGYQGSSQKIWMRNSAATPIYSTSTLAEDTWYHVCATRSSGGAVKLYLNGSTSSGGTGTDSSSIATDSWRLGNTAGEYWGGSMIEFAVWNGRELAQADVDKIYNSGSPTRLPDAGLTTAYTTSLTGYYPMDTNFNKFSGTGGNNGSVSGATVGNATPATPVVQKSVLPTNTIFNETDTKSYWWLQDSKWKGGAWIPTLDGATADTDGVTRTQSTSGSGVNVWTTSSASTFTLDTSNKRLNGYQGSNTGSQSMYTKMPHKLSTDSWQIDWTVILDSGHNNNTAVFLTLGSFAAIGYSPSPSAGHEYIQVVANQGNTDNRWHTRCRAYPTGGSLSSITYGSQGSGGQNGGNATSSTTYFRMTGTSTTVTVQAFTDSARTAQLGSDDVVTINGTQFGLGDSQYIGVATDDFHLNMDIKDIKVTGFVA